MAISNNKASKLIKSVEPINESKYKVKPFGWILLQPLRVPSYLASIFLPGSERGMLKGASKSGEQLACKSWFTFGSDFIKPIAWLILLYTSYINKLTRFLIIVSLTVIKTTHRLDEVRFVCAYGFFVIAALTSDWDWVSPIIRGAQQSHMFWAYDLTLGLKRWFQVGEMGGLWRLIQCYHQVFVTWQLEKSK